MTTPRIGLALSGGGFRAAFFHIGILARMAELDLLRHIDAISTVSGGSIVGALYYIKLKQLLENNPDDKVKRQDYLRLVAELESEFLKAVQHNLRMHTFSSVRCNLKMILPKYSRSDHIGELYDRFIYQPAFQNRRKTPILMKELRIFPKSNSGETLTVFNPTDDDNEIHERYNKVPVLNINATVLNTGHDWHFTAVKMGEVVYKKKAEKEIAERVDKNTRLETAHYEKICGYEDSFPLGKAVAASACFPGVFPPLPIHGMYPPVRDDHKDTPTVVQLVDGGVYDNQAIATLLQGDIHCDHLIISDGAGQMRDQYNPPTDTLSVFSRATDVLMSRMREDLLIATLQNLDENAAFMHMSEGLPVRYQPPRGPDCKMQTTSRTEVDDPIPQLDKDVRGLLSRVRTDLDSFTDTEAYCLMAYGYAAAKAEVDPLAKHLAETNKIQTVGQFEEKAAWAFEQASHWLEKPGDGPKSLIAQLEASHQKLGKAFRLARYHIFAFAFSLIVFVLGLAFLLGVIYAVARLLTPDPITVLIDWLKSYTLLKLIIAGGLALLLYALGKLGDWFKFLQFLASIRSMVARTLAQVAIAIIVAFPIKIYLCTLDKYYLYQGQINKDQNFFKAMLKCFVRRRPE